MQARALLIAGGRGSVLDALIELFVLVHRVVVGGQARIDIGGDLFHLIGDVRARKIAKDRHHAVEVLAGTLEGLHGVFPRGGSGIFSNGGDLGIVERERFVEGGAVVLDLNLRKRRELVGQ